MVSDAKTELRRRHKADDPGRIVAELSFGFWCGLFNRHYERSQRLWPILVKPVFPRLPGAFRSLRTLESSLNELRALRNRVFHHEPIWHWQDLTAKHDKGRRLVRGISPDIDALLNVIDRFPAVLLSRP